MKLYLISLDYPFYEGEVFIEDELKVAKDFFDSIHIISLSGHVNKKGQRKVPKNCKILIARKKRYEIHLMVFSILKFLSLNSICEIIFSRRKLNAGYKEIFRQVFIYYYYTALLNRVFKSIQLDEDDILYSYWMAAPAYFLAKSGHIKCKKICRTHRFDCFIDYSYQPFRREILKGIDTIYSISESGKKSIESKLIRKYAYNVNQNLIQVSRLGIFKESDKMNPDASQDMYLEIVTCSNINKVKRLDLLINALLRLDINIHWVHIGSGELETEIKNLALKLEDKTNIQYEFLGRKEKSEILDYYANNHIDLFINCSDSEGIPVSIMEAMSYGIAVVARNVGGNREIVNNTNGFLLGRGESYMEIADAINRYVNLSIREKEQLRFGAYNTYFQKYNAHKNYNDFYQSVVRKG